MLFRSVVNLAHIPLLPPQQPLLFILFLFNGLIIAFYINLIISFASFWTTETWALRFIFSILLSLLSGSYFPLDMLPKPLYHFALLTPLPYLFFIPTRILIGRFDSSLLLWELTASFAWVIICGLLARFIWQKGNKIFSFWGK